MNVLLPLTNNADSPTHLKGCSQPTFPKSVVNLYITERKNSDGNRTDLEMSDSDKPAIMCHDAYGLTLFKSFVNPADGTGEYPWMKAEKTVLLAPFQIYLLIHKVSRLF